MNGHDDDGLRDVFGDEFRDCEPPILPDGFEMTAYLRAFPDVRQAILEGMFETALDHYREFGITEQRLQDPRYRRALADTGEDQNEHAASLMLGSVDAVFVSASGYLLIIGWVHDNTARLEQIDVLSEGVVLASVRHIARCRRADAETAVNAAPGQLLGFWTVAALKNPDAAARNCSVRLHAGYTAKLFDAVPSVVSGEKLREVVFEYYAAAQYFTNPQIASYQQIDNPLGSLLVELSVQISLRIISKATCLRFGPQKPHYAGSLVICLYGKAEFLFLQSAFFTVGHGWQDYEFIYVTNSPELTETLQKEAAIASRLYDASISIIILPDNAGFGAANNAAVNFARSKRILIVNPDVFPRTSEWADQHTALIEALPPEQTAMFGAPLYYDDGSLMHAGMFFDIDLGLSVSPSGIRQSDLIRVEHYGKGAPPNTPHFLQSRKVPAVTGAFMSIDRDWFERLGGFSLEYVFGHYEDADLCLKSLAAGVPVWMHNLPFWHLEGKGSTRRPVHEGGSLVNRWHFTKTWGRWIREELTGKSPPFLAAPKS